MGLKEEAEGLVVEVNRELSTGMAFMLSPELRGLIRRMSFLMSKMAGEIEVLTEKQGG